jgi:hypothetical protein
VRRGQAGDASADHHDARRHEHASAPAVGRHEVAYVRRRAGSTVIDRGGGRRCG